MEEDLRLVSIELSNVKGLPKAEMKFGKPEPGKGQLIALIADNGGGKTSFLLGMNGLFTGGWDTDLIRDGATKAEIRGYLSNTTAIRRVITWKGMSLKIEPPEGSPPIKEPETYMKRLGGVGFDPIRFDGLKKDDRLKYLMKVMPMYFTSAEIAEAMRQPDTKSDSKTITELNKLIAELVEKRGGFGSRRDEKASTAENFRKVLLTSDQQDKPREWKKELAALEAKRDGIVSTERDEIDEIAAQLEEVRTNVERAGLAADDGARAEFARQLGLARAGKWVPESQEVAIYPLTDFLGEISTQRLTMETALAEAQAAVDRVRSQNRTELERLAGEIATAQTAAQDQARASGLREEMEKARKEAEVLGGKWDEADKAVKSLEGLRKAKLNGLMDGLEIREDGEVYIDGRLFDEYNTGFRYMKAMEIGTMAAGDLGLLIADDAVHLGPDLWEEFQEAVIASGLTVVAARLATPDEIKAHGKGLRSEPAGALVV